jgi:hypothetical protein
VPLTENQQTDDYDSPWKEIFEQYFREFIEFFFPEAHSDIDWEKGYVFLDKELQQITRDAASGRKYVDKLVQVWLKNGKEEWALIHTDVQAQRETDFDERMYMYNYRLYDRHRRHAASFAVISGQGNWRPGKFSRSLWGCEVRFRFPVVHLSDYAKDMGALKKSDNPFAAVVLAHLHTQRTAKNTTERRREKMTLIRHLYQKNYSRQDIVNLFRFIDWLMRLPEEEDRLFWKELSDFEEEKKMPYVTSVERIGYQRGMEEGTEQGIEKGQSLLLSEMIASKFGIHPDSALSAIQRLKPEERTELGKRLFHFETQEALHDWVRRRTGQKRER